MLGNHTREIRECCQQAAHCVQQAEAQNDPKVKSSFWSLHGAGYCWRTVTGSTSPQTTQAQMEKNNLRHPLDNSGNCLLRAKGTLALAGQTDTISTSE
jgi:hypothetical protein